MLKARNKKLSLLLVLAMLMTMFAGIGTASAANADYAVPSTPSITEGDGKDLGTIFVTIEESEMLGSGQWLLVNLPSGCEINTFDVQTVKGNVYIAKSIQSSARSLEIYVTSTGDDEARFKININADVENVSGDLTAVLAGPIGTFFPRFVVTLAKVVGTTGEAEASIQSVKSISEGTNNEIDIITIEEKTAGTIKEDTVIKVELPKGFAWSSNNVAVAGAWGLAGHELNKATSGSDRDLVIKFNAVAGAFQPSVGIPGRIALGNDPTNKLFVDVEDNAKLGEVEAKITVKEGSKTILSTNLLIANYSDFDVQVNEDTVEEVFAGQFDVELGTFFIEEGVGGSILPDRTIILDLPAGVKWITNDDINDDGDKTLAYEPTNTKKKGDNVLGSWSLIPSSKAKSIRTTTTGLSNNALKVLIEDIRVKIEPDFEGDLEITVRGTAGVEGTVKVAKVVKPVKLGAKDVANVVIGQANQKAANILIVENGVEAIMDDSDNNEIVLELEKGVRFSSKPTVKVAEGDLEIDSSKLVSNDEALRLVVKYASSKEASTIEISNVDLTVDRTVPVGALKAYIRSAEDNGGNSAIDETNSDKSPGNVVIANVVTPADGGLSGEFKINSNIYYVNGVAKVMDVAPYIKGDRTYTPMRYVAEMIGAEVVWDDAARTVTLTKGDDVVVFTIGSETYTVNGEAMTADVAPEITNGRTMLPARFVAEAFGAVVGWDPATRTVIISQ